MKWIGQHIYDLASRFRNDVFLEDISTGTIASGAHLGLDSNNKIVKADDGGGDLTSIVAGTGLSGTSLTGPIPTLNVDATQPNIDSIGTDGDTLAILSDQLVMSNATASMPTVKLTNTTDDNGSPELIFEKLRDDDAVAQGQNLGAIWFRGQDSGQNTEDYAYIIGEIDVSTHGQESGSLSLGVANHDGGNGTGLKLTGGSADNEIDVVVGLGANSVTTLAGSLLIGDIAIVADGNSATVDADIFDIESATASRPRLSLTNSTNDATGAQLMFFKDKAGADGDVIGNIFFRGEDSAGTAMNFAHIIGSISESAHTDEAGKLEFKVAESDGTTTTLTTGLLIEGEHATDGEIDVTIAAGAASTTTIAGTLTMGTVATIDNDGAWVGGVIPSAKLDADTAHLAGAQTFTGTKTLNSFKGTAGATVTNILDEDAMGSDSATALATQQSIKAYADTKSALATQKQLTFHSFTDDIDTTKHYVGLVDADSESATTTGVDMPLTFPVASKLLQVTLRSNKNLSGLTYTWRLETQATGVGYGTGPTIVGTQSGAGPAQVGHAVYDFTESLDSGDNVVDAFDAVYLSIQSGGGTSNTKYFITCVWEVDVSSY